MSISSGFRGFAAVMAALAVVACSPAAAPAGAGDADGTPAAPVPDAPAPIAPEPTTAGPDVQGGNAQGANMQSGDNPGGGQQQAGALDPQLVGTWVNEKQINSPGGAGGFASFSTVMTMHLNADGSVQQFTQSVGGGGEWSSDSGRTLDFEGRWRAANNTLLVHAAGLPDFMPAATYTFSGEYLVTQSDMGRLIWQRR